VQPAAAQALPPAPPPPAGASSDACGQCGAIEIADFKDWQNPEFWYGGSFYCSACWQRDSQSGACATPIAVQGGTNRSTSHHIIPTSHQANQKLPGAVDSAPGSGVPSDSNSTARSELKQKLAVLEQEITAAIDEDAIPDIAAGLQALQRRRGHVEAELNALASTANARKRAAAGTGGGVHMPATVQAQVRCAV
jgi:hypothetical protein